jgi:hypothetical protein
MRAWFCAALLSLTASAAAAETVVLQAVERGVFREDGSYELGPEAAYTAGHGEQGEERRDLWQKHCSMESRNVSGMTQTLDVSTGGGTIPSISFYASCSLLKPTTQERDQA